MNYPRHWNAIAILIFFGMAGETFAAFLFYFFGVFEAASSNFISFFTTSRVGT